MKEKMKLEYEIARAHECADLMKKRLYSIDLTHLIQNCSQDIVPIVKAKTT